MFVGLQNLDGGGATVTFQGYLPNGTPYTGPVAVNLEGLEVRVFDVGDALGGDAPQGGWIEASTPSGRVDVFSETQRFGGDAVEASPAVPLPDLLVPPPLTSGAIAAHAFTSANQVSDASGLANPVTVTVYEEPADPLLPPVAGAPFALVPPLAPFETRLLDPDTLSGVIGFTGSFAFQSAQPFFAAGRVDSGSALADEAWTEVPTASDSVTSIVALRFGREPAGSFDNVYDFALSLVNAGDAARTVTLGEVRLDDGTPLETAPRTISLAAHESREIATTEPPFDDLFGDPFATTFLRRAWIEVSAPAGVSANFFEFDASQGAFLSTARPMAIAHQFAAMGVFPQPSTNALERTFFTITNPGANPLTVNVRALVPVAGRDADEILLPPMVVPGFGQSVFTPDGVPSLSDIPVLGHLFTSNGPFSTSGWRERRTASELVIFVTPVIVDSGE